MMSPLATLAPLGARFVRVRRPLSPAICGVCSVMEWMAWMTPVARTSLCSGGGSGAFLLKLAACVRGTIGRSHPTKRRTGRRATANLNDEYEDIAVAVDC